MPSSIAPVTVILAGSSLCAGAGHGGNRFLDYEPDVSGRVRTQKGEGEEARERETMLSLPFFYLFLVFLTYCALMDDLASAVSQLQLLNRG